MQTRQSAHGTKLRTVFLVLVFLHPGSSVRNVVRALNSFLNFVLERSSDCPAQTVAAIKPATLPKTSAGQLSLLRAFDP